jgi:PAS domain S-box-containing protein
MLGGQSTGLGIGLLIAGLLFVLAVWALLRIVPKIRPEVRQPADQDFVKIQHHADALLMVQSGGRVQYVNKAARDWFELLEGELPDIERLARRIRPGETFLEICAAEGQARFSINGRLAEARSFWLPGQQPVIVVSMSWVESGTGPAEDAGENLSASVMAMVANYSRAVSAELSINATLQAAFTNAENLIPSDFFEIKLWDSAIQGLMVYRMNGPVGVSRQLQQEKESQFGGFTDFLVSQRRELVITDTRSASPVRYDTGGLKIPPMGSYIGMPLLVGQEFIGTIEIGVTPANGFSPEEVSILRLVAGHVAVALRNAKTFEDQQRWTSQLFGLTTLSQSVSSLRDLHDLFVRLVDGLSPLFNVNILGFLLYDEPRRILEGQTPFFGLSNQFVQIYKTTIRPNSLAEKRILDQDIIASNDASHDEIWADLGLQNLAQAASMRDTSLIPLVSAGRFLGYLQLSNHRQESVPLTQEELRLLNIVVNQVSAIIENALLVQQARQRNQRTEAMRRIASLVSSPATLDEILRYSVQEVAQLLQAEVSAIFLVDEEEGVMRGHIPSVYGVPEAMIEPLSRLNVKSSSVHMTVAGSQRAFISGNLSKDRRILGLYRPIVRRMLLESAIVVPLVVRGHGIGELMLGSHTPDLFTNYDVQVAATVASQLAVAVDGSRFNGQTDDLLRRRADMTVTISRIAREFNTTNDVRELLRLVYDEALKVSYADCGSALVYKPGSEQVILEPEVMMSLGHNALSELAHDQTHTLNAGDYVLLHNVESTHIHAGVKSLLLFPIAHQDQIFGMLELHSSVSDRFDETVIEALKILTIQAAIALSNVFRYREQQRRTEAFRKRIETLSRLFEISSSFQGQESLEPALEAIADGIRQLTPFNVVLISLYDEATGMLQRVVGQGIPEDTLAAVKAHRYPWQSIAQFFKPEFLIGKIYFIPFERSPVAPADIQFVNAAQEVSLEGPNAWNSEDMLVAPMWGGENKPLGIISLDVPRDGKRPDADTLETFEAFAEQAVIKLSSSKGLAQYKTQISQLSVEVARQKALVSYNQQSLPMFLSKDIQQTVAITNLNQRARHIRSSLQLTEAVSRQIDSSSALTTFGQQVLTSFDMSASIIARDTAEGPRITEVFGSLPRGTNPEAMFGQRNPLRTCLQTGETLISSNLDEDEVWHDTPFLTAIRAKSFICIPIVINNKPLAAVLVADTAPLPTLSAEDRQVYFQISRQVSIILQNLNLLSETRQRLQEVNLLLDFSRRLSGLNPLEILQALLDSSMKVVPAAHAGVVLAANHHDGILVPQASNYADNASIMDIPYLFGEGLAGRIFLEKQSRRIDEVNFAFDYGLSADNLLKYRKATGGRLPISSLAVPIRTSERDLGVMLLDNFNTPAAFRPDDEAILLSLTQQVALSLENVRLVQDTQERAGQLQALNAVAAAISSSLKREELVQSLLDRLQQIIPYDTSTLWLRNENRMIVAEARGYSDTEERKGLVVDVADSALINEMIRSGQPINVADVRADTRFPSFIEAQYLSWLGIPLIVKGQVIGVIMLEKAEQGFYNAEQIQLSSTFASQAAVALDNANLFEESVRRAAELDERSQRLAMLNQFSSQLNSALTADQILRLTGMQLLKAMQAQRCMIILLDSQSRAFLITVLPDESGAPNIYRTLPPAQLLTRIRESLGVYTTDKVPGNKDLLPLMDYLTDVESMMILPIETKQVVYAIAIQTDVMHHFMPVEIELARTIGYQAAIALESADLYQSTLATAERMSILNQVSAEIGATLNPEEIYQAIHGAVSKLMPLDAFIIALHDLPTNEIDGVYVVDMGQRISGVRIPYGEGLSGRVIATGQPLLTLDEDESDAVGGVTVGEAATPHSIVAVPMYSGSRVVGMLSAQTYQYNAYDENDQQLLGTLANQATIAIQNARLFAETQQFAATLEQRVNARTAELEHEQHNTETLLRILTEVSASLDLDRALSRTLALLNEAIGAEQGTIMLVHAEDNMLHYRAGYGYASDTAQIVTRTTSPFKLKIGDGLAGWVVKNRKPVLVEDLYQDPRWVVSHGSQQHRSAVVAPLVVGEDIIGAIMVFHRKLGYFTQASMEMVQAIGNQVAISINNAQLYELIRDQAERLGSMLRNQQMDASRQQAILEAVADGVLVTDPDNKITFVNASIENILEIAPSQLTGQSLESFAGLFGKTTQTWTQTIRNWSQNPGGQHAGESYAEQISLDNGRVVLVHLAPIIWHSEFLGTVSIFRDITHEVEVDRLKSEFVATVSHELRTPMTAIRGYVDVMLMGAAGALTDNQNHFLTIVKENTERLNILVNDLLDISRIEAGRVTLSIQLLDLEPVAEDVVAGILKRSQEDSKPMSVALDVQPGLPNVFADPERIRQVIGNLVDNAYNYTPANGMITVLLHKVNGDVQVDVKDNGIGIAIEDQPRVFERFYRGEDPLVLATPGTGLGLPIVRQLVEMHHGRIWLTSSGLRGDGSTFSFTLPAEKIEE